MSRKILAPFVVLALIALACAGAWHTVRSFGTRRAIQDTKVSEAERVLYYVFTEERGPQLRLSGAEDALILITHALLPPGVTYDPTRRIRYGIRLRVTSGDRLVWDRSLYTQTRQSKEQLIDGVWRYENSFLRESEQQVTDDRMFIVHMPPDVPTDSVLEVTLLGDGVAAGLVRFYNRLDRGALEQQVTIRSLTAKKQRNEVMSNTYEPWTMLPRREQLSRVRFGTERLSAIGEQGIDYSTQVVYYTGFRLPLDIAEAEEAITVHRQRFAALNIVGPTELTVAVDIDRGEDGLAVPAEPQVAAQGQAVELFSVSDGFAQAMPKTTLPAGSRTVVAVPPGLHSVRLTTDSDQHFDVRVTGPRNALFGAPAAVGTEPGLLRPDEIRIPLLMSDTSEHMLPIAVAGMGETDPLSRLVRIEVRFVDESASVPGAAPAASGEAAPSAEASATAPAGAPPEAPEDTEFSGLLTVTFVDRDGKAIRQAERLCTSERAPYEYLDRTAQPPLGISEPVDVQLVVPVGVSQLSIRTSRPAAIRLFRYLPDEQVYELPYREAALGEEVHWRYARIEKRVWWPMRPSNHQELGKNEQLATLVAQARLELRYSGEAKDERAQRKALSATVIEPLNNPERHMIIEPLEAERVGEARADWGVGMVAALPRGREESFRWDASSYRRARLHYWLEPADLGQEVTVSIDGAPVASFVARTTQGSWELPLVAAGEHRVQVSSAAQSLELFIDRAPVSAAIGLYRLRTVTAMDREPLRLQVTRRTRQRSTLHAVIYAPWKEVRPEIKVRVVISGGQPKRVEGAPINEVTKADREEILPPARSELEALFTDRQSGRAGYPRIVSTVLGDDIVPGTHFVEIYSVTGQRLWARFYITNYQVEQEEDAVQWKFRDVW